MPSANSRARATHTAPQTAASRMPTAWARRWNTPRSRASIATMKAWNPTRTRNSVEWSQDHKFANAGSLLLSHFLGLLVGQVLDLVLVGFEQVLHSFLALVEVVLGHLAGLLGGL